MHIKKIKEKINNLWKTSIIKDYTALWITTGGTGQSPNPWMSRGGGTGGVITTGGTGQSPNPWMSGSGGTGGVITTGYSYNVTLKDKKDPDYNYIIECLKRDGMELKYVKKQRLEFCTIAIYRNPYALSVVIDQTDHLCQMAMDIDIMTFCCIRYPTKELVEYALKIDPEIWKYINKELFPNEYNYARLQCL